MPPTVALLVTARPVPAEVKEAEPVRVFAPAKVWVVVETSPGFVASARKKMLI